MIWRAACAFTALFFVSVASEEGWDTCGNYRPKICIIERSTYLRAISACENGAFSTLFPNFLENLSKPNIFFLFPYFNLPKDAIEELWMLSYGKRNMLCQRLHVLPTES